ncbi:hypothetical protein GE107_04460 [Cohnella sp. CFH 77786]|uniref:copper amine oxidase N-terminal domain-containing protein n=1 Tax=Cohnella sp. CFH 77786 TaxID=2662265 RepID=UPI001C6082FE|nr:copper amine oxidase N-terminal domain-containing protein [Cohnella sp. CFH 77786]MBW5445314.1 hypothetical protein [Cohnella sp. CFH 77786]
MGKRRYRKIGLWLSMMLVVVLVGCQAVFGLNLDGMLLKQLEVRSLEQSGKLDIELDLNDKAIAEDEPGIAQALGLFKKMTFTIDHAATDGTGRLDMKGSVTFGGKGAIPLELHTDEKSVRLDIGGLKQPIVMTTDSLNAEVLNGMMMPGMGFSNLEAGDKQIAEWTRSLIQSVASYFVHHLPNPPKLEVGRAWEPVNGTFMSLTKVHAELNGEQLGELIPAYLDNMLKDEAGFKDMLRSLVKAFAALPPEARESLGIEDLPASENDIEAFVNEGMSELLPMLQELRDELAEARKDEMWGQIFDKGISLKTDLYVDDSLFLRKTDTELVISPAYFAEPDFPIRSIRIHGSADIWNVNGDVTVQPVDIPEGALTEKDLESMQAYDFVRSLDSSSVLYDLLKNDLQIDDQSFEISSEWGIPFVKDKNGKAYVPVRYSLEQLGDKIIYTHETKEIRFADGASGQEIVFNIGSAEAYVNGQKATLSSAVYQEGPYAYIAADDLFGILRAEYTIEESGNGESVMKVKRDL